MYVCIMEPHAVICINNAELQPGGIHSDRAAGTAVGDQALGLGKARALPAVLD